MKKCWNPLLVASALSLWLSPTAAEDIEPRKQGAMQASAQFMQELKAELVAAMQAGGPANAIAVCTDKAPAIAGRLSREHGWQVTRVGTRVRNPLLGMPDPWEQEVLEDFAQRHAKGEPYDKMAHGEVVEEPKGRYYRFMKAIPVGQPCLACHGPKEQIDAKVMETLQARYPFDEATGYRLGELRGAVSIKQPLAAKDKP